MRLQGYSGSPGCAHLADSMQLYKGSCRLQCPLSPRGFESRSAMCELMMSSLTAMKTLHHFAALSVLSVDHETWNTHTDNLEIKKYVEL